MSPYVIRKAKHEEAGDISELALRSKAYWGYSDEFMKACSEELTYTKNDMERMSFYVIAEGDKLIGFYALLIHSAVQVELEALFIDPLYIGKGYGKALIRHAITESQKLNAKEMIIQGDPNAEKFYKSAGGKQIGERESNSIAGRYLPLFSIKL